MKQTEEVKEILEYFRLRRENCPFIIYTGYYPDEISAEINELKRYKNVIVKFGRYIPNRKSVFDEVLGVTLASDNQWAERIS